MSPAMIAKIVEACVAHSAAATTPLTGKTLAQVLSYYTIQLEAVRWGDLSPCVACIAWERKIFGRAISVVDPPVPIRACCRQCEWLDATWTTAVAFAAVRLGGDLNDYQARADDARRRADSGPRSLIAAIVQHAHEGAACTRAEFYSRLDAYAGDPAVDVGGWRFSNVRRDGDRWLVDVPGEPMPVAFTGAKLDAARDSERRRIAKRRNRGASVPPR